MLMVRSMAKELKLGATVHLKEINTLVNGMKDYGQARESSSARRVSTTSETGRVTRKMVMALIHGQTVAPTLVTGRITNALEKESKYGRREPELEIGMMETG